METNRFWQLIERSKLESSGDCDTQSEVLQTRLHALPEEEIIAFDRVFTTGERWKDEDLERLYPRLCGRYGWGRAEE